MAITGQFREFGPFYSAGALVSSPRIWHYIAGTSTLLNAYTDRAKTTTAAQPLVGDANGVASAYFDGLYKIVVKTSSGDTLFTWDNFDFSFTVDESTSTVIATGSTTSRLLADRFAAAINVKDEGAVGDGVADDRQAFVDADADTTGPITVSEGTYLISSNLTITSSVLFMGGLLKPASGVTVTLNGGVVAADTQTLFDLTAGGFVQVVGQSLRPEWWGAVGGAESTTALQNTFSAAAAASSMASITLSQLYLASAKITVATGKAFSVIGSGRGTSGIVWTTAASGLDLLAADLATSSAWNMKEFGLYARFAGCTGYGLRIGYITDTTTGKKPGPIISIDVSAEPSANPVTYYWLNGIEIVKAGHAQLLGVYAHGNPTTLTGNGLMVTGFSTPAPYIEGSFFFNWDRGITKGNTASDDTEGGKIIGTTIVKVNYGIYWENFNTEPDLQVMGGHINAKLGGIVGIKTHSLHVQGVLFHRRPDATGTYNDISVTDGTNIILNHNILRNNGTSGTTTAINIVNSDNVLIDGNTVPDNRDVGIAYGSDSSYVTISDTNALQGALVPITYNGVATVPTRTSYPVMDYGGYQFDGSTDYLSSSSLSPIADGKVGTFIWYGRFANAASAAEILFDSNVGAFRVSRGSIGKLTVVAKNAAGTSIMSTTSKLDYNSVDELVKAGTYSIMVSWDLATAGSMRCVINGHTVEMNEATYTNDTIDYTSSTYTVGRATNTGSFFTGDMYLMWFHATTALDVTNPAIRRKFIDLRGEQMFLGHRGELPTGSAPILFLAYSPFTSWPANRGSTTSTWTENGTPGAPTVASTGQFAPFVAGGAGVSIAETGAALATTATKGFMYVPTTAGAPTGTPLTVTGQAPLVIDTTTNKLYFYSSGVWRDESTVTVIATGSTTPRLLADRFAAAINVKDEGAVGDGVANDRQAFADADADTTGPITVSEGTYLISSNLTITSPVIFMGGVLKPASGVTITLSGGVIANVTTQIFDTTASATSYVVVLTQTVSPCWWGVTVTGTADSLAAWNQVVKHINNDRIDSVQFPPGGVEFSAEPTTITGSAATIAGAGWRATTLTMQVGAGTNGTFFRLGDGATQAGGVYIHDFEFTFSNYASLNGTKSSIDVANGFDNRIERIYSTGNGMGGFIKLGDNGLATTASRTYINNCRVMLYGPADGIGFDIQRSNGMRFHQILIVVSTSSVTGGLRGIYYHPTGGTTTIDSGEWDTVEFNFPGDNVDTIIDMDASQGIIINQWFTDVVADHSEVTNIKIHVDAGAHASSRINNVYFTNLRSYADGGGALLIDNTGQRDIGNLVFQSGVLTGYDLAAVRMVGTTDQIDVGFIGVNFTDIENTTAKAAIDARALSSLRVIGCNAASQLTTTTNKFTYLVNFLADAPSVVITGNDCTTCTLGVADTTLLSTSSTARRVIENNTGPSIDFVQRVTTTNATVTTIANYLLKDARVYHFHVLCAGVKSDGTQRASYEFLGTFYRTAAGAAVQQGATTMLHSVESDAAWDVAFAIATNTVQVRVTGVAATTIKWGCTVDQRSIGE